MSTVVTCLSCSEGEHHRCQIGHTRKGVLGGWVCGCPDPVCIDARKKRSGSTTEHSQEGT